MRLDTGRLYAAAWRWAPKVPGPVLRAGFTVVSDVCWLLRRGGVDQLERNLARALPDASHRELRRTSRAGMRSYMRYFREAFALAGSTPGQIAARVRLTNVEVVQPFLDEGRSLSLALGHMGNWDLAGAWSSATWMPVVTVAERLRPEEVFQEFLSFRTALGMRILALGDDGVFRDLVRAARAGGSVLPLLADRDLTAHGIEVDLFGERTRVAAGPAALAQMAGVPLFAVAVHYERLRGSRRRAAGSPWGLSVTFSEQIAPDESLPRADRVADMTQRWVDFLGASIRERPEDWHMLQKVFVADLDPVRYAATTAEGA
ncbi:phosphatidylinositol mannoside acyltransferase [Luteimicrobium subarcticum]|uniref:KDO2-lipid IV(A) lauroyltransferase n=1 Tax=Luteimicrobium subarcticum TaxID=620910 RepID=A0A2M8W427_9MICO|nr:phosphatidylinositol mannoside acyltransferase [Luteimicrobium subarcticum]PJI85659.1 KDO2-lipid IV(A) lauroyltransferase [Luteimicrobium subarcticum]